jgi:acylphosphatase
MIARHLWVSGRVQGVGYRDALCREARARALRGWVRNRRDGRVEALLQGTEQAVAEVVAWARRGPVSASVAEIAIDEAPIESDAPPGFLRRPTE